MTARPLTLRVASKTRVAEDICRVELVAVDGGALPPFTAGAHVDVGLPGGLVRQYSLCNGEHETHRYVLGVLREAASRGGSQALHDAVAAGHTLEIGLPRNLFPLAADARHSVLIGGGIGITPLLSMADALWRRDASFELHYGARSQARAAFADELSSQPYAAQVALHLDDGPVDQRLDLRRVLAGWVPGRHAYVCGPAGLIDATLAAAREAGWPEAAVHVERFAAAAPLHADGDGAFDVRLAASDRLVHVPVGRSVVEALADADVEVPVSCEQGVCGTCLTRVIAGVPDHRDCFLTDEQRAAGDAFLPCCSRSLSPVLVLDL